MNFRKRFSAALAACLFSIPVFCQQKQLADYVNTLQGTNSKFQLTRGNTYPTTALPFGMHTWTPQTGKNGDGWKYQYFLDEIRGFQQAHQCSSWTNDYLVFSLMPETGKLVIGSEERGARFSHKNETARPYYYRVKFDNAIQTEISPTERGAHMRFSFPESKSFLVLDGYTGNSAVKIIPSQRKITGYVRNGANIPKGFASFFVITFDKPFIAQSITKNGRPLADSLTAEGNGYGAYIEFKSGEKVQVKTASSYVSLEQAELNLKWELGNHKTLEDTKTAAARVWNRQLGQVKVEGASEADKATFYSCMFRANLFSRMFYELDPQGKPFYRSPNDGRIHKGYMFTDTGFWDTFRAQFPLNALLHPKMHGRYVNSMLASYEQFGWLPSWAFPGETGGMVGNHAISLFADAWAKGIRTFDPQKALLAYDHEVHKKGPKGPANGRDGWEDYDRLGYVSYPKVREATAKTLEYAYDDFCGYTLARATGNKTFTGGWAKSMFNYRNVYNPATRFMEGKDENGKWKPDFDPTEWGGPFTEGNAWHWQWSVFHDIKGLINLMGGRKNFTAKLDSVFTQPGTFKVGTYGQPIHEMTEMVMAKMGQYAHGNQPIQHMVYLYSYAGEPWKTQFHAREVMRRLYNATENGYPGDEDQGQTSSWYVLSAMGFYSVCPGTDEYVIGSPAFPKVTITFENGRKMVIIARGNTAENVYIKSAILNGKPYTKNVIRYSDLVKGGTLELTMSAVPNKSRGTSAADQPFSVSR